MQRRFGLWLLLVSGLSLSAAAEVHLEHLQRYGYRACGYNPFVLQAIDRVQSHALDGGGYFMGIHATPAESPIGYPLQLFGQELLSPPRSSSYCSGSTYAVFIEALNAIFPQPRPLSPERLEALRLQEPNGSRREDGVKAWGWWNADGFGCHYALVQYLHAGQEVAPGSAQPGDFANLSWTSGNGHSVVFLGYERGPGGELQVRFFSSQAATNGLGDRTVDAREIRELKFVRLTAPERIWDFDPTTAVQREVPGDRLDESVP